MANEQNTQLISALSSALEALTVYGEYEDTLRSEGRGCYDSTYSIKHARPAVVSALKAAGGYRGDWVALCFEINDGKRLKYGGSLSVDLAEVV